MVWGPWMGAFGQNIQGRGWVSVFGVLPMKKKIRNCKRGTQTCDPKGFEIKTSPRETTGLPSSSCICLCHILFIQEFRFLTKKKTNGEVQREVEHATVGVRKRRKRAWNHWAADIFKCLFPLHFKTYFFLILLHTIFFFFWRGVRWHHWNYARSATAWQCAIIRSLEPAYHVKSLLWVL